jgi:serine/threonine-protein kinase
MPSLIPGYEYDIFISYRQKDNKGDRWVSEFAGSLKTELESTFKEEISVYFDINPHDGLLETHDVDESLKEKIKCLVFIPIISRTYCDPKSYAWEHEFKAFAELASKDQFGLKVKLPNGNVANRVIPVRIYDLDATDIKLCESVLGGVLRSVDFIFRSAGVNRPLLSKEEDPQDNLNHTNYRNQINKVANAIKDIITAINKFNKKDGEASHEHIEEKHEHKRILKPKIILGFFVMLALVIPGYVFIHKYVKPFKPVEKTIAVLPFRNLSNDTTQIYFCDGFMEEILNNLQTVKSFTVRSRTSSDQYRDTKKSISIIGNELNANYLVEGSVGREGNKFKIWVQLIDSKSDKHIWSNEYTREMQQIFSLQSEIAKDIATELKGILSPDEIEKIERKPTGNLEAYNYYLQANFYYRKSFDVQDLKTANKLYGKATELDPGFALAYTGIAYCLMNRYWFYQDRSEDILPKCKQAIDRAFEINPDLAEAHLVLGIYYYMGYLNYPEALRQFEIVLKEQPKNSEAIYWSGAVHRRAGNWALAESCFTNAFELDPRSSRYADDAAEVFDLNRNYSKAEYYYNMSIMLLPDWIQPYVYLSQMFLRWQGDIKKARAVLENGAINNSSFISDSLFVELKVIIDLYEGNYKEALIDLSFTRSTAFQSQFYFRPKYLYYATIYGFINKPELEQAYYDSARIMIEKMIIRFPQDPRLYSSLGITYAGLGFDKEAVSSNEKAVKMLPVSKEAWKGVYLIEDLAHTFVMIGKYPEALEQIKYLLTIPGFLSTKILEMDPIWVPLKNQPEFKNILEKYNHN